MKVEREKWNKFVIDNNGSFLQSFEWCEFQKKLGATVLLIAEPDFQSLLISRKLPFGRKYLYAPHGPILKKGDISLISKFIQFAKIEANNENAFFLRIDPNILGTKAGNKILKSCGFKRTYENQPEKSIYLDLKKSEKELLNDMEAETRYAIRTAEKRGVEILSLGQNENSEKYFEDFWQMFNDTMSRSKLRSYQKNYFQELLRLGGDISTKLYLAKLENNIIASAIFLYFGNSVIYLYAASKKGFGRFNAPSFILWRAITDSKKEGYKLFDFWGISYDKKKWSGMTNFKRGFGGNVINYIGAWDLPFNKMWYLLFEFYKRFLRKE